MIRKNYKVANYRRRITPDERAWIRANIDDLRANLGSETDVIMAIKKQLPDLPYCKKRLHGYLRYNFPRD